MLKLVAPNHSSLYHTAICNLGHNDLDFELIVHQCGLQHKSSCMILVQDSIFQIVENLLS